MVRDDTIDTTLENAFRGNEARWLELVPPELEWDESEAALLVEEIAGGSRMRGYA